MLKSLQLHLIYYYLILCYLYLKIYLQLIYTTIRIMRSIYSHSLHNLLFLHLYSLIINILILIIRLNNKIIVFSHLLFKLFYIISTNNYMQNHVH